MFQIKQIIHGFKERRIIEITLKKHYLEIKYHRARAGRRSEKTQATIKSGEERKYEK